MNRKVAARALEVSGLVAFLGMFLLAWLDDSAFAAAADELMLGWTAALTVMATGVILDADTKRRAVPLVIIGTVLVDGVLVAMPSSTSTSG